MRLLQSLRVHRRLVLYRALDWLLVALITGTAFLLDLTPGFRREFSLRDKTIQFPMAEHGTVSSTWLGIISLVVPVVLLAIIAMGVRRSPYELHQAYLGLGIAMSCTALFVHVGKNLVGRPRPDFISRCQPAANAADPPFGLSTLDVCTQTNQKILLDGLASFPSGHTAYCFAGLGFVSFYLAGKMRLFDERGYVYKPLIALIPLLGAILVGISRIDNYRHHWEDVATGGAIGLLLAYFAYRLYFPSLTHSECEKPFPALPVAATTSTIAGQSIANQTTPNKLHPVDPVVLAEEGKQAHHLQHP